MKRLFKKIYKKVFELKNRKAKVKFKRHSLVGKGERWKLKRDFQFNFLISQGLKKSDIFLDIGCGTLRGGIPIIDFLDKGNYYGIDVRKEVFPVAREELKFEKLIKKFPNLVHFQNFSELDFKVEFDVVFAFSVLIHMEDSISDACLNFVSNNLNSCGVFYANVNINENSDESWQGFPVVFRNLSYYRNLANKYSLNLEVVGQLKNLGHFTGNRDDEQYMLKFYK